MNDPLDPALQSPVMRDEDGTDLANELMSPRSDGEGGFSQEQSHFLKNKGKGRADSVQDEEVDEEAEARRIELHLKAMAKAEQERRKTIRRQTANANAHPPVNLNIGNTVSDLSRRGSAALSRAASKRSQRSTKGHQRMPSFSSTDTEPLPKHRGSYHPSEAESAYELSQFSPPPTPLHINTQASTSAAIDSPTSYHTSPTHTESTITSPVSPSATEQALKTGSRFVEDLESQNMAGREINFGNRSRSSTNSTIRPSHAKKSSSTSSFNLFQPLTQSTYDLHRPISRQSVNSGRPSMTPSASNYFASDSSRLLDETKKGKRYKYDVTSYESDEEEEQAGGKQTWFEWFCCGCCAEGKDGEQGGRTNPME